MKTQSCPVDQFCKENFCLYQRYRTKQRQLFSFFPINEQGRGRNRKREKGIAGGECGPGVRKNLMLERHAR